jgi:hypothetical protein
MHKRLHYFSEIITYNNEGKMSAELANKKINKQWKFFVKSSGMFSWLVICSGGDTIMFVV